MNRSASPVSASLTSALKSQSGRHSLASARSEARAWADTITPRRRQQAVWSFTVEAVRSYAAAASEISGTCINTPPLTIALTFQLDSYAQELAQAMGRAAAAVPLEEACYQLSAAYAAILPEDLRTAWGAYYTPPVLTRRLLDMAKRAGIDWRSARVLDPACGGGAFLLPVALEMRDAMAGIGPEELIRSFAQRLRGFEIDPFAAWLTQAWLEIAFAPELASAGEARFPTIVEVCDSLRQEPAGSAFDLVIGNPPYGRVKLNSAQRERYARSLFGHANMYGLFTDMALRWTKSGGVIAFVTPTSFLAGEYFKSLRALLQLEAPPHEISLIESRKGVFEDVLQEALLAAYKVGSAADEVTVHHIDTDASPEAFPLKGGSFKLPSLKTDPWLVPRSLEQQALIKQMSAMRTRLRDWGYKVSTGPLVWNRYKPQLRTRQVAGSVPLIWAEAVGSDGTFKFRAEKRNHKPFFRLVDGDEWLRVSQPCVLLQRTTAKEQARRLIAAEMSQSFLDASGGSVTVENHLNMIRPVERRPLVSPAAVAAVLNSKVVDQAFRCISGSVAVSAFELEALPLPSADQMRSVEAALKQSDAAARIEGILRQVYEGTSN